MAMCTHPVTGVATPRLTEISPACGPGIERRGRKILEYVLCATIFTKEPFGIVIGESIVDPILILVAVYGAFLSIGSRFAVSVAMVWCAILGTSYLLCTQFHYPMDVLLRQGVVAAIVYTGVAGLLERTQPLVLLEAYRRISLVVAAFGIVQVLLSFAGVLIYIKVPGHLDALAYEPSHYAIAVAPAAYLSLREIFSFRLVTKWSLWVVPLSVALTVSFTGLLLLVFVSALALSRRGGAFALATVLTVLLFAVLNSGMLPEHIQKRIDASQQVIVEGSDVNDVRNLSILSPLSNWNVAVATLLKGRLLGNGIGGHVYAYFEYYVGDRFTTSENFGVNATGGHSLFIRCVSELGVLGGLCYALWIVRGASPFSREKQIWWTLSAIYLTGRALKLGGFFELGLPVFVLAPICYYGFRLKDASLRSRL